MVIHLVCTSKWGSLDSAFTSELALTGTKNVASLLSTTARLVYVSSAAAMMFDDGFDEVQEVEVDKSEFLYAKAKHDAEDFIK